MMIPRSNLALRRLPSLRKEMSRVAATVVVTAAFLLAMTGVSQAATISARGTLPTFQGPTIGFSAANDCIPPLSTRPSVVGLPAGGRIWTKTTVTSSNCIPFVAFNQQVGFADGFFGASAPGALNGQPGTLQWLYVDGKPAGSPDLVTFVLRDIVGNEVYSSNIGLDPAPYRGTPGGVWTFGF
jgi:hypothetical protein